MQSCKKMMLNYYPEKREVLDLLSGEKRLPMGVSAATQLLRKQKCFKRIKVAIGVYRLTVLQLPKMKQISSCNIKHLS